MQRFRTEKDRQDLRSIYAEVFQRDILSKGTVSFSVSDTCVRLGSATLPRTKQNMPIGYDPSRIEPAILESLLSPTEAVATCVQMEWPCLLVGKTGSGKSSIVYTIAELCDADFVHINLSPSSDVNELVGCFEQVDVEAKDNAVLSSLQEMACAYAFEYAQSEGYRNKIGGLLFQLRKGCSNHHEKVLSRNPSLRSIAMALGEELSSTQATNNKFYSEYWKTIEESIQYIKDGCLEQANHAHFQWVDGVLAEAMTRGSWLLLENVNLCPSSVLDRLNPVMENNGELLMAECGVQKDENAQLKHRVVKAHPNFRLFLTMDPEHGEISRAMRNRCIEISLLPPEACCTRIPKAHSNIFSYGSSYVDSMDVCWQRGLRSASLADNILSSFQNASKEATSLGLESPCIKILASSASLLSGLLSQGSSLSTSLDFLRSLFHLPILSPTSTRCLIPSPHLRSQWLIVPRFAATDWQGRILRIFCGDISNTAELMPGSFDIWQLSTCSESLAIKFDAICPSLPADASVAHFRNFVLLLFLLGHDGNANTERNVFLDGCDFSFATTFKLMSELFFGVFKNLSSPGDDTDVRKSVAVFERLSGENDVDSSLARLPQKVTETIWKERMESINVSQAPPTEWKVLDVSYLLHDGRVDSSSNSCRVTPVFFPLLQAIDKWISYVAQDLHMRAEQKESWESFRELLTQRDRLWVFLHDSFYLPDKSSLLALDENKFIVQWRWFKKSLERFELIYSPLNVEYSRDSMRRMNALIATIDTFFYGDSNQIGSPSIWSKSLHPLVPSKASQWEAIVRLRNLAALTLEPTSPESSAVGLKDLIKEKHASLFVRQKDKMELLSALATLHFSSTDEMSGETRTEGLPSFPLDASNAIKKQWEARQLEFFSRLDQIRIDQSIETVENMLDIEDLDKVNNGQKFEVGGKGYKSFSTDLMHDFGRLQLSPSTDCFCREEEMKILRQLCQLLLESATASHLQRGLVGLLSGMRYFINEVLVRTNWPVSDLRVYQTLIWACEDVSPKNGGHTERLLRYLLPLMLSMVLQHSIGSSVDRSGSISAGMEMPLLVGIDAADEYFLSPSRCLNTQLSGGCHRWRHTKVVLTLLGKRNVYSTLENYHARALQARDFVQVLSAVSFQESVKMPYELYYMTKETLLALRKWFPKDADAEMATGLHTAIRLWDVERLRAFFKPCSHTVFANFFEPVVLPLLAALGRLLNEEVPSSQKDIALAQVYTGLLRFHLFLPTSPLDPGRKPLAKLELISSQLSEVRLQVSAMRLHSGVQNGDFAPESPIVNSLLDRGMLLLEKRDTQKKKVVERPAGAPPYIEIFRESRDFGSNRCSKETVLALIELLETSAISQDSKKASDQTNHWHQTAEAFCSRFASQFGDYEDVVLPLVDSVRLIQVGLRDLSKCCLPKSQRLSLQFDTVRNTLKYPMGDIFDHSSFYETMRSIQCTSKGSIQCRRAIGFAILARLSIQKLAHGLDSRAVGLCKSVFADLVKSELEGDEKVPPRGDSEMEEERTFREQFPDHWSEFKNLLSQDEDEVVPVQDEEVYIENDATDYVAMSPDETQSLCLMHRLLFSDEVGVNDNARQWTFKHSMTAGTLLLETFGYPLQEERAPGTAANVMALSLAVPSNFVLNQGDPFRGATTCMNHFYSDPNPTELSTATKALDNMIARMTQLLTAFPGNEILIGIFKVVDKARKLDLHSTSVGKMMACLEILLRHAQDWEQHASQRVQIGSPLNDISQVVATWRKLELQSWSTLLSSRADRFLKRARAHWGRIYKVHQARKPQEESNAARLEAAETDSFCENVLHVGIQWSPRWVWKGRTKDGRRLFTNFIDTTDSELLELAKAMDTFVLTSPLGEFNERLQMLKSFSSQLYKEAKGAQADLRFADLQWARLLLSLGLYYEQFLPSVLKRIEELRIPIENKLRDQMKLAKWDEQSYYALTESTEKNHRNLMRCLRDYDAVLSLNVGALIDQNLIQGIRSDSSAKDEACFAVPTKGLFFPHLQDNNAKSVGLPLKTVFVKNRQWTSDGFQNVSTPLIANIRRYALKIEGMLGQATSTEETWGELGVGIVQDFCSDIFHRIELLRAEKTSRQMKERALVDLFRELKRQGYSNTKWAAPKEQQEMVRVFQLPNPSESGAMELDGLKPTLQESESYFSRSSAELSRLRSEAQVIGSKYMSKRETEAMLNFSEHGFLLISQQRSILSSLLAEFKVLKARLASFALGGAEVMARQVEGKIALNGACQKIRSTAENIKQLIFLLKASQPLLQDEKKANWASSTISKLESHLHSLSDFALTLGAPLIVIGKDLKASEKARAEVENTLKTFRKCQDQNASLMCIPKDAMEEIIQQLEASTRALDGVAPSQNFTQSNGQTCVDSSTFLENIDCAVKVTLLAVQGARDTVSRGVGDSGGGDNICDDHKLWTCHSKASQEWAAIDISTLNKALDSVVRAASAAAGHADHANLLADLGALCELASSLLEKKLRDSIQFYRETAKLQYVLIRVFRVLISKGYCSDDASGDDAENDGDAGGTFEDRDGTGMGEGDAGAAKDVTDQLESEEQLLGLESDTKDENQGTEKQEEKLNKEEAEQVGPIKLSLWIRGRNTFLSNLGLAHKTIIPS